jgi:hypothetical protein
MNDSRGKILDQSYLQVQVYSGPRGFAAGSVDHFRRGVDAVHRPL